MAKKNPWEESDILAMAVRLRQKGVLVPEVDNMLAEILEEAIKMATRLLLIQEPQLRWRKELFLDRETQADLMLIVLTKLKKVRVRTSVALVNWVTKTTQNSLRNLSRDLGRQKRDGILLGEDEIELDSTPFCRDFYGYCYKKPDGKKVVTQNFDD